MVYMLNSGGILMVNVTIYGIHGSYGYGILNMFFQTNPVVNVDEHKKYVEIQHIHTYISTRLIHWHSNMASWSPIEHIYQ